MAAGRVPETGKLGVHHGGNRRGDLGVKQTLDGDAGARQGAVLLPPGQGGSWQEGGSGGRQSLSCLSVSLPALPQAAILQQTAEYIFSLEQEKTRLLQQNTQLKRFIQVVPTCVPRGWDGMGRNGMGGEGKGQSWLAGEGTWSLFLGVRARPSALTSQGTGMFHTLLAGQGSPIQPGIPHLAWGGLWSRFPFGALGYGPVAAPAL